MNKAPRYSYEDIQRYLQHKMDAKEMHAFEKAMMDDPFLADAIEGYRNSNNLLTQKHLEEIKKQIATNEQPAKVVPFPSHETQWWKIAAIVFIIVTGTAISYVLFKAPVKDEPSSSQIAQTKPEEIPVAKDSIAADATTSQTAKASGGEAIAYKRNASQMVRKNAKAPRATVAVVQSKKDTAALLLTDKMDETTLITSNETASRKTGLIPEARRSATLSAGVVNQELKEATAGSIAPVRSKALAKTVPSEKDGNMLNESLILHYPANKQRDVAGSTATIKKIEQVGGAPEGGWQNFDNYVNREIKSFKDSTDTAYNKAVTLEFFIDEQGRPSDIQIIRDADKNIAGESVIDKAIQILMNGPRWIRNKDQSKVKVTMEF